MSSSASIHHDLLAIIFAYSRLFRRETFSTVSRQSLALCSSHTYIISLWEKDIEDLFEYAYQNNRPDLVAICLKNPLVQPGERDNRAIRFASEKGYFIVVKILLADHRVNPVDRDEYGYDVIQLASQNGHLEVIKLLLADKRIDPRAFNSCALTLASANGQLEIVQLFLADPRINPDEDRLIIGLAAQNGYFEVVKLLLTDKRIDPSVDGNYPFCMASYEGHTDIVQLLLSDTRVNPADGGNWAIKMAAENKDLEIVKLLLADPRVYNTLDAEVKLKYENQIKNE